MHIVKSRLRIPAQRGIVYGPLGSWKTSTLAHIPRMLWDDWHGSTNTLAVQPDAAWDPATMDGRPKHWGDLLDHLADVRKLRGDYDGLITDGLDDVEREILIPEALRRSGKTALSEDFGRPGELLLQLHKELKSAYEELWRAGFNLWFTCHDQKIEMVNPQGANYLSIDLALYYVSGKVGKTNCPVVWRDWADHVIYLTTMGQRVIKGDKDKVGKAVGDASQHVAYLRREPWLDSAKERRLDSLDSPLLIESPGELWRAVDGAWKRSFNPAELRAEALELGGKKEGVDVEVLAAALAKMNDPDQIREIISGLK